MINQNHSIPLLSEVRDYVIFHGYVKLLSDVSLDLCKIAQSNSDKRITLYDINYNQSKIRKPRKIGYIVNHETCFVN